MISYMYQYENGVKKNNVGYAKLEVKNGQFKITLHMQLLGQSDSVFPTYLIHRDEPNPDLIYIGDSLLKNQLIDSKFTADENNIMGSGYGMSDMGGLLIFLNNNIFFASGWDDKPIVAQELLEAMKPRRRDSANSRQERTAAMEVSSTDTPNVADGIPEAMSLEEELKIPKYKLPRGWKTVEMFQKPVMKEEAGQKEIISPVMAEQGRIPPSETIQAETKRPEADKTEKEEALQEINPGMTDEAADQAGKGSFIQEEIMGAADHNNEKEPESNRSARFFFDNYPRIYPFEDNEILFCVKIEPKDIGLLPKDVWGLSSNSFLLHGFYCYHHLIFAKMRDKGDGFIIGVPGIYHSREQFMARMFGFENFKSIRKRELRQGDFGYWYIPISMRL